MTPKKYRILLVDDEPDIRSLLKEILEEYDYIVTAVHDAAAARTAVRMEKFDAVLLDIWMPGVDGITLLKEWNEHDQLTMPVIMLSAHGTIETAVEAVRLGAYDFLEKPIYAGRLEITLRNAVSNSDTASDSDPVGVPFQPAAKLVGSSKVVQFLRQQINEISAANANVLIIGEPGSGRKTIARIIHESSRFSDGPVTVLDWLTGEDVNQPVSDIIHESINGTLLIPDLHAYDGFLQNRLLGLIHKLSDDSAYTDDAVKPRVIATTTSSIRNSVKTGRFRPELFVRLGELAVQVPALREHKEDIPELVGYFTDQLNQLEDLRYKRFTTAALNTLRHHSWAGNLTELHSVLRQAMMSGSNETVTDTDVEPLLVELNIPQPQEVNVSGQEEFYFSLPFRDAKDQFERDYLLRNLRKCKSYSELSKISGLHRTSLFRKMKEHGIEISPRDSVVQEQGRDKS